MNIFNKVFGYKIISQNSVDLLNTNEKWTEEESKETIPITRVSKHVNYLGVILPSKKKICMKNFNTLNK